MALDTNLVAHYLLNNNADDIAGAFDGVDVGTVEYQGDQLDPLAGSVTIPNSSASSCSYWKDSGSGMVFTYTTTIITSLATDNYSNLRMYSDTKDASFQADLLAEGYYPKPLTEPTTTNLLAHYPLTGTAEDSTGNYDGTEVGNTYVSDNEFGSISYFDGTNDYMDFPLFGVGDGTSISYSFWINFETIADAVDWDRLIYNGECDIGFNTYDGNLEFIIWNGSTAFVVQFTPTLGTLYHVVGTYDGVTSKLYIDDLLVDSLVHSELPNPFISNNRLCSHFDGTRNVNAKVSNYRIYSRPITQQEITDIYNYEKNFRSIDIDDGLVAYYPLANNSLDNYYNEYDGTDTGMVYDGLSGAFGTSKYVSIDAYSANTIVNTTDWSISAWFKLDTNETTKSHGILTFGGNSNGVGVGVLRTSGLIGVGGTSGGINYQVTGTTVSSTDTWYHLVVTRVGGTGTTETKVYVDGVFENDGLLLHGNGTDPDLIGGNGSNDPMVSTVGSTRLNGNISKVRLYHSILTPEQIEVIYNEESPLVPTATATVTVTATAEAIPPNIPVGSATITVTATATAEAFKYPVGSATITVTATAEAFKYPVGSATITVTATAQGVGGEPTATATITVTATAQPVIYVPVAFADVSVVGTGTTSATISGKSIFTFIYTIQQSQPEVKFKFVYSIEQPKTATIIKRVNV